MTCLYFLLHKGKIKGKKIPAQLTFSSKLMQVFCTEFIKKIKNIEKVKN